MLDIRILTIFPSIFDSFLAFGNPARGVQAGLLRVETVDLRDFTEDRHHCTDDYPYGGGSGMVMKPEPVVKGVKRLREITADPVALLMTPQGSVFNQAEAEELARRKALIFVCGRYEGFDERIRAFVDKELSIGDYILSGGETAAMVIIDAICRLIPGVTGADSKAAGESFYEGLLEYPQYTRPRVFEGMEVPAVLVEGNHELIRRWRKKHALARTISRRPDLLLDRIMDPEDEELFDEIAQDSRKGDKS
jgi:tRNA (guanine37-N1)-methyltransferase